AILYSPELLRKADYYLESEGWDYREHLAGYHKALRSMGAPVTFVQGTQDFFKYKVLIVAAYDHIDENMLKRLEDFAKKGGNVIFTARSGSKAKSGIFAARALPEAMERLIGAKIVSYDQIPREGKSKISHRGKSYDWNNWAEILELNGSIPLATHSAQYYTGRAVASFRILSRGSISYFGFDTDSKSLEQAMVRKIFERMRISFDLMELGTSKSWKDGFWFAMNFGKESQRVPMDPYATVLMGDLDQGRGEVTVWTEKVKDKEAGVIRRTPVTSTVSKPTTKEGTKDKKDKDAKVKKEKVKKIKEAPEKEKSLFEQTMKERKKKNN
ncbi:MAG: beta-galactosidase trimerization domain-containing protein, partial [Bacteroidota bacterium]